MKPGAPISIHHPSLKHLDLRLDVKLVSLSCDKIGVESHLAIGNLVHQLHMSEKV